MLLKLFDQKDINHSIALKIQHLFIEESVQLFRPWVNLIDQLLDFMSSNAYLCQNFEPWESTLTTLRLIQNHLSEKEIQPVGKPKHSGLPRLC